MERNVVSLETAKKLKAAGFPQEKAEYVWVHTFPVFNDSDRLATRKEFQSRLDLSLLSTDARKLPEYSAAPTAQEIADELESNNEGVPITLNIGGTSYNWEIIHKTYAHIGGMTNPNGLTAKADTMAEALAALWLKLKEQAK